MSVSSRSRLPLRAGLALAFAFLIVPLGPALADGGSIPADLPARWQADLDQWHQHRPIPGISAAVQSADGSTWTGVSGMARLPHRGRAGLPVTSDTPFEIASVTKTFVAATILQLAEEGKVALDDHLSHWLPGFPRSHRITLRHLLSHTSGIRDIFSGPRYEARVVRHPRHVWTFRQILGMIGPPLFAPGAAYSYSNSNYILLGRVIELVTHGSVSRAIRTRLLEPLGLDHTWFQGEEPVPVEVARGYGRRRNGGWFSYGGAGGLRPSTSMATFVWAAGAMVSTPRDLATWARALYGGRVLKPASLSKMVAFGWGNYGLGARRSVMGGRQAWGHGGSLDGFETSMWYLPGLDAAVVVSWNRWPLESDPLAGILAARLVRALDPDVTPPVVTHLAAVIRTGATVRRGRAPIAVAWGAHDDQGRIARVVVRERLGSGAWRSVAARRVRAGLLALDIPTDLHVTLALRAVDVAGNRSPWKRMALLARTYDDDAAAVLFDAGWQRRARTDAIGGGLLVTTRGGSRLTFRSQAASVAVVALTGPGRGRARVSFDTGGSSAVDLASGSMRARRVVLVHRWAGAGQHRLAVVASKSARRPMVDVDAFLVLRVDR